MGQILPAGEESQERPALLRDVVTDRAAQHGIAGLERVEDRALRGRTLDVELHFTGDVRQPPQVWRGGKPGQGTRLSSTGSTAGRSHTKSRDISSACPAPD